MLNKQSCTIAIGIAALASASSAAAFFHSYRINELYSNADGSIQFIELTNGDIDGEMLSQGVLLSIIPEGGEASHDFVFPDNLPSPATANTSVLIATQGFADLGIVAPDFVMPIGFLFTGGGRIDLGGFDALTYAALPTDGVLSMNRDGTMGVNSPMNFAGVTGTIPPPVALDFAIGWNLGGNGSGAALDVAAEFGDANTVNTVWKWIPSRNNWAFYTPTLSDGGAAFAAANGYELLASIDAGEGFWLNAKSGFSVWLAAGAVPSASFQTLGSGWNLIAVGDRPTPNGFNAALSVVPPASGEIPLNLTTLWTWDNSSNNWYFYAPGLDKNGTLSSYIQSKGYLEFGSLALEPTTGFWVNRP